MIPSKMSVMIGGLKPTGFGDFITKVSPAGVYSLNNNLGAVTYPWVYRIQDDTWKRLPDACQTDRYFEKEEPEKSAEFELMGKTKYVSGKGNLRLVDLWKLTSATYFAPYNEWDLGDLVTQTLGSGRAFRYSVSQTRTDDAILKADWMSRWTIHALDIAYSFGMHLCVGSFASGGPDLDLLPFLRDMLRKTVETGGIWDFHEYGVEGPLRTSKSSGALHYRWVHDLSPTDCRPNFIISEYWWGVGVQPGGDRDAQLDDAEWYCTEIHKDPYVLWASAFQLNEGGESHIPADMLSEYAARAVKVASTVVEPPIEPAIPTASIDGDFAALHSITDSQGHIWTLGTSRIEPGYPVLRDGVQWAQGYAVAILYHYENVYVTNDFAQWFRVVGDRYEEIVDDPRLIELAGPFWVAWPLQMTEPPFITDHFNAPRSYSNYLHEGTDFDSYENSTGKNAVVLAAQDGVVEYVSHRKNASGAYIEYGLHVVIRHPWGTEENRYRTLYAHLSSVNVTVGQKVKLGDPIAVSGATGTSAIHLHFNVHDAATGIDGYFRCPDCGVHWPSGVINPENVMRFPGESPIPPIQPPTVTTVPLRSVHGRADGGPLRSIDIAAAKTSPMINAYKLYKCAREDYRTLINNGIPAGNILVRFEHIKDRRVTGGSYVNGSTGIYDLPIQEALTDGTPKWIEIFNEPNIKSEGLGVAWSNASEFCGLALDVISRIRQLYPTLKILSPALSPQLETEMWWRVFDSMSLFAACDGYAAHSYWDGHEYPMDSIDGGRHYRRLLPFLTGAKQIFITEASNNHAFDSDVAKGQQYGQYLKTMEPQVARVDFFCISSSNVGDGSLFNARRETWVLPNDTISAIPGNVK